MARPSKGTISARVWEIAEKISRPGQPAFRDEVVAQALSEGIHPKTASTQFGAWKRAAHPEFDGVRRHRDKRAAVSPPPGRDRSTGRLAVAGSVDAPDRHWSTLLKNGFDYGADWTLDATGALVLDRPAPDEPGVYVFVEEDEVVYVGTTRRRLADRMRDYRVGHDRQKTSARIKRELIGRLTAGRAVRVLFCCPGVIEWRELPVEIAAGLEAGLISRFKPRWNRRGMS